MEYDAQRDEKEQHEAKMKEVEKIEKFHNDKENPGKIIPFKNLINSFLFSRKSQ